jgi:hypothetical protein
VNPRAQGAVGIGRAIAHYSGMGYAVFTPVSDVSRYDLVVDTGERLMRVEVKTTTQPKGEVSLRTMGGNRSWGGVIKRVSSADCDVVFAVNLNTGAEREFSICELEGKSSVTLR